MVEGGYEGVGAMVGHLHSSIATLLAHHKGHHYCQSRLLLLPSLGLQLLFPPFSLHPRRYSKPNLRFLCLVFYLFIYFLIYWISVWLLGKRGKYMRKFGLAWTPLNWEVAIVILQLNLQWNALENTMEQNQMYMISYRF